jgi:predicted Ser/Thr protein kinase
MPGLITPLEMIFILEERLANAVTEKERKKIYKVLEEIYRLEIQQEIE